MAKNLAYFMRESAKTEEIIAVPGVESIKDEKGNVINFEVKRLSAKAMQDIRDKYKARKIAKDKNGNPLVNGDEVVYESKYDSVKAGRHLLIEALVYPDLKDPELMAFFNCNDITDMPLLVFSKPGEYAAISEIVGKIISPQGDSDKKDTNDAGNL